MKFFKLILVLLGGKKMSESLNFETQITINLVLLSALNPCVQIVTAFDLSNLQSYLMPYLADVGETKEKATVAIVPAKAFCSYNFIDYVSNLEICELYGDQSYMKSTERADTRVRVKCVTDHNNRTEKVQIMDSVKSTISMLSPYGNTTKRTEPGNCVLLLFFTRSCPGSATIAPHYNALQRQFPYLRILAIDAFKHRNLNTEFGVSETADLKLQFSPILLFF
jgi:thiol-disulfide isomerase/thioredoxin